MSGHIHPKSFLDYLSRYSLINNEFPAKPDVNIANKSLLILQEVPWLRLKSPYPGNLFFDTPLYFIRSLHPP